MKLYIAIIGNQCEESTVPKVILSEEPLAKDTANINQICGIDGREWPYPFVLDVYVANVLTNSWTEEEADKMDEICKLFN